MYINIIKAKIEDGMECSKILMETEIGRTYYPNIKIAESSIAEGILKDEFYIAFDGKNNYLGFIWFTLHESFHSFPYLHIVAVNKDALHKGVGKKLLMFFEDYTLNEVKPKKLSTKLFLVVADFNKSVKELYEKIGYTEIGIIPSLYRKGVDEHLMMKINVRKK